MQCSIFTDGMIRNAESQDTYEIEDIIRFNSNHNLKTLRFSVNRDLSELDYQVFTRRNFEKIRMLQKNHLQL